MLNVFMPDPSVFGYASCMAWSGKQNSGTETESPRQIQEEKIWETTNQKAFSLYWHLCVN